ncbi:cytochrome P450 [Arthrobacter sp. ISL-30]|uniref:cytochrome P450 n=1 Tax=Arthrobacter sp. ISL-30 TaxID=2819109 RepID=UPI0027E0D270|nr:cytochrome P450 [Arthrobacter sp. ISL-30]
MISTITSFAPGSPMVGLSAEQTANYVVVRDPAAVRDVLHRPGDFVPANALVAATPLTGASLRVLQKARFALPPVLASNCTDSHAGVRKVVAGFFTPATVAGIEPRIRELARAAVEQAREGLESGGTVDLVQAVAANPPAQIMLELLGLPERDLPALKQWSLDSLELFWGWPDKERQLELAHSAAEFYGWLRELVLEFSATPDGGSPEGASRHGASRNGNLFAALARHGLTVPEICSLGYFLLIAGQETTTQLISTALFRSLEGLAPVTWKEAGDAASARSAVRHILATESSVPTWRRVAATDTVLDGERIPAGAEILLELTGNHGLSAAGGSTAYSLAFGSGIHRCLGAKLAELEAAVVLQETAAGLPDVRLAELTPEWLRLLSFQAPRTVVVR